MNSDAPAYGLWSLVIINSAVFILFAYSFFKPKSPGDWRSFSAFSAFLVALFAEMYGFPLTIYFLSGWLQSRFSGVDWFSHDAGHLLEMLFGWKSNPHAGPFHILSFVFIGGGFVLIAAAWKVLYDVQQKRSLAITGPYSYVRHPQYVGFILVMFGFLLQWPTILTLAMFPVLTVMYVKLARTEEHDARSEFGEGMPSMPPRCPDSFPSLDGYWARHLLTSISMANRHDDGLSRRWALHEPQALPCSGRRSRWDACVPERRIARPRSRRDSIYWAPKPLSGSALADIGQYASVKLGPSGGKTTLLND